MTRPHLHLVPSPYERRCVLCGGPCRIAVAPRQLPTWKAMAYGAALGVGFLVLLRALDAALWAWKGSW